MKKLFLTIVCLLLFASVAFAEDVNVYWTQPAQTPPVTVTHWDLYMGLAPGVVPSATPFATTTVQGTSAAPWVIQIPSDGVTRYFIITASNTYGESGPSNEVIYISVNAVAPAKPTGLNMIKKP